MKLTLPEFQFRFMTGAGNVIFPGNFHPVGTQQSVVNQVQKILAEIKPVDAGDGGIWIIVGGSGGLGSGARLALGVEHGAHTVNVSFDAAPDPLSKNKIRKIGSPGYHRNLAIERELRKMGRQAFSHNGDAFDPHFVQEVLESVREKFAGQKINGIVWALAAPRAVDARTGNRITSALKPLGKPAVVKTFSGRGKDGEPPKVVELELQPGSPSEAVATQFVMGGGVVSDWMNALGDADLLADGVTLLTLSYRGNPLNEAVYHKGLIGLAKADLEFQTSVLNHQLSETFGGRAIAVEAPAVVTEASGGIPGVPFYMSLLMDVMGDRFENPLASMRRLFSQHLMGGAEPVLDEEGLLRMDDRELTAEVQGEMLKRFNDLAIGDSFRDDLYDAFMTSYGRTRGFGVPGVEYDADFDTDEICKPE